MIRLLVCLLHFHIWLHAVDKSVDCLYLFSLAAGEDYDAISEAVVFNSESVLVQPLCVEINITDDDVVESIEQLSVTLTSLSPDQLSDDTPQATVTIKDDNDSK